MGLPSHLSACDYVTLPEYLRTKYHFDEEALAIVAANRLNGRSFLKLNEDRMKALGFWMGAQFDIEDIIRMETSASAPPLQVPASTSVTGSASAPIPTRAVLSPAISSPSTPTSASPLLTVYDNEFPSLPPSFPSSTPSSTSAAPSTDFDQLASSCTALVAEGKETKAAELVRSFLAAYGTIRGAPAQLSCPFPGCSLKGKRMVLEEHILAVHIKPNDQVCDMCLKRFSTTRKLARHMKEVHNFGSQEPPASPKPKIENTAEETSSPGPSSAGDDEKVVRFDTKGLVDQWMKSDPANRQEAYISMCNFFDTQSIPTGTWGACPFPDCSRLCKNKADLRDHINIIHIKYHQFKCTLCQKSFMTTKKFHLHMKESHEPTEVRSAPETRPPFPQAQALSVKNSPSLIEVKTFWKRLEGGFHKADSFHKEIPGLNTGTPVSRRIAKDLHLTAKILAETRLYLEKSSSGNLRDVVFVPVGRNNAGKSYFVNQVVLSENLDELPSSGLSEREKAQWQNLYPVTSTGGGDEAQTVLTTRIQGNHEFSLDLTILPKEVYDRRLLQYQQLLTPAELQAADEQPPSYEQALEELQALVGKHFPGIRNPLAGEGTQPLYTPKSKIGNVFDCLKEVGAMVAPFTAEIREKSFLVWIFLFVIRGPFKSLMRQSIALVDIPGLTEKNKARLALSRDLTQDADALCLLVESNRVPSVDDFKLVSEAYDSQKTISPVLMLVWNSYSFFQPQVTWNQVQIQSEDFKKQAHQKLLIGNAKEVRAKFWKMLRVLFCGHFISLKHLGQFSQELQARYRRDQDALFEDCRVSFLQRRLTPALDRIVSALTEMLRYLQQGIQVRYIQSATSSVSLAREEPNFELTKAVVVKSFESSKVSGTSLYHRTLVALTEVVEEHFKVAAEKIHQELYLRFFSDTDPTEQAKNIKNSFEELSQNSLQGGLTVEGEGATTRGRPKKNMDESDRKLAFEELYCSVHASLEREKHGIIDTFLEKGLGLFLDSFLEKGAAKGQKIQFMKKGLEELPGYLVGELERQGPWFKEYILDPIRSLYSRSREITISPSIERRKLIDLKANVHLALKEFSESQSSSKSFLTSKDFPESKDIVPSRWKGGDNKEHKSRSFPPIERTEQNFPVPLCHEFAIDPKLKQDFRLHFSSEKRELGVTARDGTISAPFVEKPWPIFSFSKGRLGEFLDLLFGPKPSDSGDQPSGGLEGARYPTYILVDEADLEHAIALRNETQPPRRFFIVTVQSESRGTKFMASMLLWFAQSLRAALKGKIHPFDRFYFIDEFLKETSAFHEESMTFVPCSLVLALEFMGKVLDSEMARWVNAPFPVHSEAIANAVERNNANPLAVASWFASHDDHLVEFARDGAFPPSMPMYNDSVYTEQLLAELRRHFKIVRIGGVGLLDHSLISLDRLSLRRLESSENSNSQTTRFNYRFSNVGQKKCNLFNAATLQGFNFLSVDQFFASPEYMQRSEQDGSQHSLVFEALARNGIASFGVFNFSAKYYQDRGVKRKKADD